MKRKNKVACITFHLNTARRSPYMPNGPNLRPEITEKAARTPDGPIPPDTSGSSG